MPNRWIFYYEGVGDHDYRYTRSEGPFPSMVSTLMALELKYSIEFVEENIAGLVMGAIVGGVVWETDFHGMSISNRDRDD